MIYLISGQPGTGKSTAAESLIEALEYDGRNVVRFDGDYIRKCWPFLKYSDADRTRNMQFIFTIAYDLHNHHNIDVVLSLVAPIASVRDQFYQLCKEDLVEIRLEEVFDKRPEEYYSKFEEGEYEPDIKGQEELNAFIKDLLEDK